MSPRSAPAAGSEPQRGKPPLDRETVLRAGLELANAEGIEAVTFRRLAEGLSVTPMALYRHVESKSDLLEGVFDLVAHDAAVTDHSEPDWRDWMCETFARMGEAMRLQRGVMAMLGRAETYGKSRAAVIEEIYRRLCDAGFTPLEAGQLQQDLYRYVLGSVAFEGTLPGDAHSPDHERHTRARLELLPSDEFPTMTRHAAELAATLVDTDVRRGLRSVIDGFEQALGGR